VRARGALLLGFALHDIDDSRFRKTWSHAGILMAEIDRARLWHVLSALIFAERGQLDDASRHLDESVSGPIAAPNEPPLTLVAIARVHERSGRIDQAVASLSEALSSARRSGQWLMLPEVAARLAVLLVPQDRALAASHLAVAESVVGTGRWFPRERAWILAAKSMLVDPGADPDAASEIATSARSATLTGRLRWERTAIHRALAR